MYIFNLEEQIYSMYIRALRNFRLFDFILDHAFGLAHTIHTKEFNRLHFLNYFYFISVFANCFLLLELHFQLQYSNHFYIPRLI